MVQQLKEQKYILAIRLAMRNPRSGTPSPRYLRCDDEQEISPSRRPHMITPHLPSLDEGSMNCKMLAKMTISPVFSLAETGKSEILDLGESRFVTRRGKVVKLAFDSRNDPSKEIPKLPTLDKRDILTERKLQVSSANSNRRSSRQAQLKKSFSQPAILSKTDNFPRLNTYDLYRRQNLEPDGRSAELRRHIQQENVDYDLVTSKAVILERYLNSQSTAA